MHRFSSNWPTWEIHPHGDEVVVPKGIWHTAHIQKQATLACIAPVQSGSDHFWVKVTAIGTAVSALVAFLAFVTLSNDSDKSSTPPVTINITQTATNQNNNTQTNQQLTSTTSGSSTSLASPPAATPVSYTPPTTIVHTPTPKRNNLSALDLISFQQIDDPDSLSDPFPFDYLESKLKAELTDTYEEQKRIGIAIGFIEPKALRFSLRGGEAHGYIAAALPAIDGCVIKFGKERRYSLASKSASVKMAIDSDIGAISRWIDNVIDAKGAACPNR